MKFYVYKDLGERSFKPCLLFSMQVVGRKVIQMNFGVFSYLEHVVNEIYEGPEEKARAVRCVFLHRLICQSRETMKSIWS